MIITFLTDYGRADGYVDVSHGIPRFDVRPAALNLRRSSTSELRLRAM